MAAITVLSPSPLANALALLQGGDHAGAMAACQSVLAQAPDHAEALHLVGVLLCLQGNATAALPSLHRAVVLQSRPDFLMNLANALMETGRSAESLTFFARALKLEPNNALAWCNQGVVLKGLERHAEAVASFEASLRLDPERVMALNGLNASLTLLGRVADALAVGKQALEIKARRSLAASPSGSLVLPQGIVPPLQPTLAQAWVVAFSLFGADETYTQGALENVRLARALLPQWICRFYCDDTVPAPVLAQLAQAGAQVCMMPATNLFMRLSWRFLVADDPLVGRYLCRDCDSRLSPREVATIDAWIASGQPFHMVRDAPTHIDLVLAGLWGGCAQWLPPLAPMLARYPAQRDRFADQAFLGDVVWPYLRDRVLLHDSQWGILGAQPFPAQAPRPDSPQMHVGSGFKLALAG